MSFTQELTCRWSTSTWTPTRLPARSFAQKLLHRSCYTGVQLTSRWSNCMWTPAKSDFSSISLAAATARRWLTKRYPLRRVGHPNVWRNAGLVCPWATLCGDRACRMGKHVVWWNAKLLCPQQPSAEIVRFEHFRTPKHVVECEFILGTGNPLQRSRRSDIQTRGKMQIWWGPAQPLRTKWGSTIKNLLV